MSGQTESNDPTGAIPLKIKKFDRVKQDDLYLVGDAMIDKYGLNAHHIDSANNFYRNGLEQIIKQGFKIERRIENTRDATERDRQIDHIHCEVIPIDVQLKPPSTLQYTTSKEITLYPQVALSQEKVYSGTLSFSCEVRATAHLKDGSTIERTAKVNNLKIGKIPIIKGSIMCNTYGKSKEALMQLKEDPSDIGGYFVVRGEWSAGCTENITFNQPKIYFTEGLAQTIARCEFISKPGDTYQNSDMLLVWYHRDGTLMVEVARDKLNEVQIPFFMLFRALGWSSDKEMMDYIVYDYDNKANKAIFNTLCAAFDANYGKNNYRETYDQNQTLHNIVDMIPEEKYAYLDLKANPENYHNAITDVLRIFDKHCLPHIGLTDASRHEKLKFIGLLIRKLLMVHLGYLDQTDRDSYRNKRIHAAGDNYAKTVKTVYNQTAVLPMRKNMKQQFDNASFDQVNLANIVKTPIYADDFERLLVQTIISGTKSQLKIKKRTLTNRLSTQLLNRKNHLHVVSTMRKISAPSAESAKQSERASAMRRVHNSGLGYICPAHSPPEGENVGVDKQLAMFATIAKASSSEVLKQIVRADSDLIHEGVMTPLQIARGLFARVFVNGHLLGYVKDSRRMITKYRKMRRHMEINPHTTIYWDNVQDEIQFFVDIGRLTRPLLIVYNTVRDTDVCDGKSDTFEQGLAITADDIRALYAKTKTIDDLLREQKIEFITPEEQQNCYICPEYNELVANANNELREYTHCDIPQGLLGITALTAPYGNHNQAPRVTYQTTQAKQTCGHYAMNWPFRMDKEVFLQYINEAPLIRTAANKYLFPNGINVMTAMMCYSGYNQEDSLIINKAARDRGIFAGSKFTYYKTELEQKDVLDNPDASKTEGLKSANYEKLRNGKVQKGDRIEQHDVIIGKYMPLPKGKDDRYSYVDRSVVYKESEPAVVHDVIDDRNEDDMRFCKVGLRKIRPIAIGDKFCLTGDTEVLTNRGWKNIKQVTTDDVVAQLDPQTDELQWVNPEEVHCFDHHGSMYEVDSRYVTLCVTNNHKMFVRGERDVSYDLIRAKNCAGKKLWYKRSAKNATSDKSNEYISTEEIVLGVGAVSFDRSRYFPFTEWLQFLGIYLSHGYSGSHVIKIFDSDPAVKERLGQVMSRLQLPYTYNVADEAYIVIDHLLANCLARIYHTKSPCLARTYLNMNKKHSQTLLAAILLGHSVCYYHTPQLFDSSIEFDLIANQNCQRICYTTDSSKLANTVQILAIMCELTASIDYDDVSDKYTVCISRDIECYEPRVCTRTATETHHHDFKGQVYCITVPSHVFMVRRNGKYCWTGNSSRSGQKGICALLMREADMPSTVDGVRPALIFNPHGIPSRMTCAQLIESLYGSLCAIRGTHADGTMFKDVDIEAIQSELENYGMTPGYERFISGITGEYIDSLVFFGPTFYQRLQKFVLDAEYSVRQALTDAITHQPLAGQGSSGGLKIGEMEKDVTVGQGASRFLAEAFRHHSDGYDEYMCRCGRPAIVNHSRNIYKCKHCGDNADITVHATSWSSKLFRQEIESIGVGVNVMPRPFTYAIHDDEQRTHSTIDEYDENSKKYIKTIQRDMVDDATSGNIE